VRIHHVVPDLELDLRKRFALEAIQVIFDWLSDGVLLFPAARSEALVGRFCDYVCR
jgi:hypothetical protein